MAKIIDAQSLDASDVPIPGLKPPVWDFSPADDGDPREVDAFNEMIRQMRKQNTVFPIADR